MKKRTLGKTGLKVSRLGLGGLFTSKIGGELEASKQAVHQALELGVNYIDTAPGYANSEEVLGQALDGIKKKPLILSTKLGGRPQPFNPQDPDQLRQSVRTSLELLGRDRIDILMIHEPDRPGQYDWWTDWANVRGPVLDVLDELKAEGLIRFTGLGGTATTELAHVIRSGRFDVVLTAFNYSLLWQEAKHEVIPEAKARDMGVIVGSPLQQGALARRFDAELDGMTWLSKPRREQFRALYGLLDEIGMSITDVALRWVISNKDVDCVLMGARSAEEVEKNVAAVEAGPLPADIRRKLAKIAAMVPFRPWEEPFSLPMWSQHRPKPLGGAGR